MGATDTANRHPGENAPLTLALALGPGLPAAPWSLQTLVQARDSAWPHRDHYAFWRGRNRHEELMAAAETMLRRLATLNASALFLGAHGYPQQLNRLTSPPQVLFARGSLKPLTDKAHHVAIVGSRGAYRQAMENAHQLAATLARADIGVISGGALGIDSAAHRGALSGGGYTVAVLGSGLDIPYPQRNRPLFEEIAAPGALLSPFALGTPPRPAHFPSRNRLIAALVELVVVVEATARSGSMHTTRWARQLAIPIAAYAGSVGCNRLICEGAMAIDDPIQIVDRLHSSCVSVDSDKSARAPYREERFRDADEERLWQALSGSPRSLDEVAQRAGLTIAKTAAALLRWEVRGWVLRVHGGAYLRSGSARATIDPVGDSS